MDYRTIISEARARLEKIEVERTHLLRMIEAAEGLSGISAPQATAQARAMHRPPVTETQPRPASTLSSTRLTVREILEQEGRAIETRNLLPMVRGRGVAVGGKDPVATLSARLSNSDEFFTTRGIGWWFKNRPMPVACAGLKEAEDQSLEGQSSASVQDVEGGDPNAAALV